MHVTFVLPYWGCICPPDPGVLHHSHAEAIICSKNNTCIEITVHPHAHIPIPYIRLGVPVFSTVTTAIKLRTQLLYRVQQKAYNLKS